MTYRSATVKRSGLRFKFIGEIIAELKKVVWLTRREAAYLTALVILVCLMVGLFLGIVDYGFTKMVNNFFLGG